MRTPIAALPAAALALALALTGCSGSGKDDPTVAAPSTSAGAPGGGDTVESTQEVHEALEAAGVPCEELQQGSFPGVTDAQSCIINGSEDIVLLRFASAAERESYVAEKDELASVVLGENWAVQTVLRETADQVAGALGGEVIGGEVVEPAA
ncbi:MAG: hypothetical protein WD794_15790 [Mycobacteriales bacterium]